MSRHDIFRRRFKPFDGEPWFEAIVDAYDLAWERDDEWTERSIQDRLHETAILRGVELPYNECGDCGTPKLELEYLHNECNACIEEREERAERDRIAALWREARYLALSPEDRARQDAEGRLLLRTCMDGLIGRDVQ